MRSIDNITMDLSPFFVYDNKHSDMLSKQQKVTTCLFNI